MHVTYVSLCIHVPRDHNNHNRCGLQQIYSSNFYYGPDQSMGAMPHLQYHMCSIKNHAGFCLQKEKSGERFQKIYTCIVFTYDIAFQN